MSGLDWSVLDMDHGREAERICAGLREAVATRLRRRGVVVAISGGIDSSVCAALAVRAFGPAKVHLLILPERDSDPDSAARANLLASHLGVEPETFDIAPALEAIGAYAARDAAVRTVLPEYDDRWKMKLAISGGSEGAINRFRLVARSPDGAMHERELRLHEYLTIVAATSYKQRLRKTIEYFHADRLHYAVVGTPNRLEYDQGFFVKNGDGSADVKPIAHLYKTQVYAMARHLGLPDRVCEAQPTTDTYSLEQGQDEFYFALPYRSMDLALWALEHGVEAGELAKALDITPVQAAAVYEDIARKRRTTRPLHLRPLLLGTVPSVDAAT
ncbi:NAD(+) synthase [Luteimonas wenzhouensis]|uniref:NH(3)-dependent NAD(+) synthetase n=1 Tax=Luteimonas wenzhouensis TaxID=2599615 RepID=A0A5C5U4F6_9GAMM|nr:NAD(+) synthase [Luteimonas wenzhouensis]NLW96672.1 NAD(+) synthase [Xanthomonadaceae bacterium]TWT20659.1 NAD(+) synthase [Luteimonas wenzhouensis]